MSEAISGVGLSLCDILRDAAKRPLLRMRSVLVVRMHLLVMAGLVPAIHVLLAASP
jgi:hypothetical protein